MEPSPPPPPTPGPLPPGQMPPGYYPHPYPPPPKKSSLLWLWILLGVFGVLFVVGILAAIAIPSFMDYQKKAKRSEATLRVEMLYKDLRSFYAENDAIPPQTGEITPPQGSCCSAESHGKCQPDMALWQVEPWQTLDFTVDEPSYFSYSYTPDPAGKAFTISAWGDLDCDGKSVVYYQIVGTIQDGNITKAITVEHADGD
jgi:type II secretory pathway pseudopilin PulG